MVEGVPPVRNAVIRKKVINEQALVRKYMLTPRRIIVPDFRAANLKAIKDESRLWAVDR